MFTGYLKINSSLGSFRNLRLSLGSCKSLALIYAHMACNYGTEFEFYRPPVVLQTRSLGTDNAYASPIDLVSFSLSLS